MAQAEEKLKQVEYNEIGLKSANLSGSNHGESFPVVKLRPLEVPIFMGK